MRSGKVEFLAGNGFLLVILFLGLSGMVAYGFAFTAGGGDSERYLIVAKNIYLHNCVSVSDPSTGECVPHWGGNQFPGYPLVLAAILAIAGGDLSTNTHDFAQAMVVVQATALVGTAILVGSAISRVTANPAAGKAATLIVALSPLHIAWPRFILTEAISIALTAWVLAELIHAIRDGRWHLVRVGIVLAAAFFVRYDAVALTICVALAVFIGVPIRRALLRGAVVALVFSLPIAVWTARNVMVGLSVMPMPDYGAGTHKAGGYYGWLATWTYDLYDGAAAAYPVANRRYSEIVVPTTIFRSPDEQLLTSDLLRRLGDHDGAPFPDELDAAFAELATARRSAAPFFHFVMLPLKRTLSMWLSPGASIGWNAEVGPDVRRQLAEATWIGKAEVVLSSPLSFAIKGELTVYRLVVLVLLVAVLLGKLGSPPLRQLASIALAFAIVRTMLVTVLGHDDPRLSLPPYVFFQVIVAAALGELWYQRRRQTTINAATSLDRRL